MADRDRKGAPDSLLKPGERPTLKTLSRATGLAVATVSRALHDAPDIGEQTKRRVAEAARQIGYRPNRAGVRLRTGKTHVISLAISTEHEMVNQHTGRLISSIAGTLRGTPYHLIVTPYFPSEDIMTPIRYILETGSADAIIMNQIEPRDRRLRHLMDMDFPFAAHGRSDWADGHAYFDFDNKRFAELGLEAFARRGRKSVLVMAPPPHQSYAQHLVAGARKIAAQRQLALEVLDTATSDDRSEHVEAAITDYLLAHPETDAIICPSTLSAMTITAAAESLGRRIGDDIDLLSKEAGDFLSKFRPGILSVVEDVAQTGAFLARAALHRIENRDEPPMQFLDVPQQVRGA